MLEFIAMNRLPFVLVIAILAALLFVRGGWRGSLMGAAAAVMISSAVVMVAIIFNATELWWLSPDKQTPLNFDVPSLLDPVVAPIEAIGAAQQHVEAGLVAMRFFAYYTLAVVAAMIVIVILMIWQYVDLRRDVRLVRQVIGDNPQLLIKSATTQRRWDDTV